MWQYLFTQDWWEHVAVSIFTGLVRTCGSIYLHRIGENMWQYLFTQDWWEHVAILFAQDWWEHVAILFTQDWWEHVAIFGFHFVLEIK
jgi:hypothetical protein